MPGAVYIKSLAHYIPGGRLTNAEVLAKVKAANAARFTQDDLELLLYGNSRKFEFLGIESRSYCKEGDNAVTMAVKVARAALAKANLQANEIDCLIATGVSNPFREPSFALVIAGQIAMETGDFFDVNDTCNGFLKSIDVASQYITTGRHRNILVVTSENPYEVADGFGIDYAVPDLAGADNRFSALTVGCGAAAMVLSAGGNAGRIAAYAEKRETANWDASLFTVPGIAIPHADAKVENRGIWTDARLVSAQVIKEIPGFTRETLAKWGLAMDKIDLFILHQLGNNVTFATLDLLQVNRARAPVHTFRECGNMASANIPVNLALAAAQGDLKPGATVLLVSSACGLSYALVRIEW